MNLKMYWLAGVLLVAATAGQAQDATRALADALRSARGATKKTAPAPVAQPQPAPPPQGGSAATVGSAPASGGSRADPRYSFSSNGAEVTDSKTGLTWRRCAEGMRFYGGTCTGEPLSLPGLSRVLAYEKSQAGWRLPTIDELATVVRVYPDHREVSTGGTDLIAFPGMPMKAFWSSTLYYKNRGDRDRTKVIQFENGMQAFRDNGEGGLVLMVKASKTGARALDGDGVPVVAREERAVAALPAGAQRFAVSADGKEVADAATGLVWARCAEGMVGGSAGCAGRAKTFDFGAAQARASQVAKSTGGRWRLPEADELQTIASPQHSSQIVDSKAFPQTPLNYFWTAHRIDDQSIFTVNFYNGTKSARYHTSQHYVRLVRDAR